jgi:HSP20 family protein
VTQAPKQIVPSRTSDEMSETAAELKVEAELPGLDEKDVELLLRDGELIIRGERQSEKEDQQRRMSER